MEELPKLGVLDSVVTNEELKILISHESPTIQCIVFSLLCKRDIIASQRYLIKAIHNQERINTNLGCIGVSRKVGDAFLALFYSNLVDITYNEYIEVSPEMVKLDSIILYDNEIKLDYKSARIKGLKIDSSNYELIRYLALVKSEPFAVLKLAKYRKLQDRQIIIDWLKDEKNRYYGIWAIREYSDTIFYPYLLKIFKEKWKNKRYSYPT